MLMQTMILNNGNYEEDDEWMSGSGVLGDGGVIAAGTSGKCVAGIDLTTNARFCIKKVSSLIFRIKSSSKHNQSNHYIVR